MSYADVYFSPRRGTTDVMIGFIDRTEKTLDIAVYSLTSDPIVDAVIAAHRDRNVKVRILTDNLQAASRYADDERLREAGIEVREDNHSGYMHHKFCIADIGTPKVAVSTGSFNWTKSAEERNAENMVIIRLKYIAEAFQREFDHLWDKYAPPE